MSIEESHNQPKYIITVKESKDKEVQRFFTSPSQAIAFMEAMAEKGYTASMTKQKLLVE